MPVKNASFNHPVVAAMVPYSVALLKVNKRINEQLKQRDLSIADGNKVLEAQRHQLDGAKESMTSFNNKLDSIYLALHSTLNDSSKLFDETYTRCSDLLISQNIWLNNLAQTLEKEE
jgi:hypothetical protein